MSSPSNRKPLNRNASSYGFYSKNFTEEEKQMLDEPFDGDLMLEIALTRLYLARLELIYNNLKNKKSHTTP